jgi:hypothetical protein
MNAKTRSLVVVALALALELLLSPSTSQGQDKPGKVRLNVSAFDYAKHLIASGYVVNDTKGRWRADQPATKEENNFIRLHGFDEYAKWYLGIDEKHGEHAKSRYKFPYGDFKNVHRCGVLAVKSRARQYQYSEIEAAADKLLAEISVKMSKH